MNLLAHVWISQVHDESMMGNLLADKMPPSEWLKQSLRFQEGIQLHHQIDTFTDSHHITQSVVEKLRPLHGRYAPVVSDVLFDHFLAHHWNDFHHEPLSVFVNKVYTLLEMIIPELGGRAEKFSKALIKYDWLTGYASQEGMYRILTQMSGRAKFQSQMEKASEIISPNYDTFQALSFQLLKDFQTTFLGI